MTTEGFSQAAACRVAGITYKQLDHWDRTGLVHPRVEGANGSGSRRRWSMDDLFLLRVAREFVSEGTPPNAARRAVAWLREADVRSGWMVMGTVQISAVAHPLDLSRAIAGRFGLVYVLDLTTVALDVIRSAETLDPVG